jgi:hypothetical protein
MAWRQRMEASTIRRADQGHPQGALGVCATMNQLIIRSQGSSITSKPTK